MKFLIRLLMDRSMHRVIHLMGMGINNLLILQIMALYPHIVKVHHIMVLPCHPTWVKWEEDTMAMAMVVTVISLM